MTTFKLSYKKAYAPACFNIVLKPEFINGTFHFFNYLKNAKACLSPAHFKICLKYFLINSYFAHPENLLLCALLSPLSSANEKDRALELILQIRSMERSNEVRKFFPIAENEVNCDSDNIIDLINWNEIDKYKMTPPPLLEKYSDEDLKSGKIQLEKLLCHSQHNERAVKQTSKSVLKSHDYLKQKSDIVCTEESRSNYKHNAKKEDFRRNLQFDENT